MASPLFPWTAVRGNENRWKKENVGSKVLSDCNLTVIFQGGIHMPVFSGCAFMPNKMRVFHRLL